MSNCYVSQILETCSALRATGMNWSDLARAVSEVTLGLDWPRNIEQWNVCLAEMVQEKLLSDLVLFAILPHVHPDTQLTWPAAFAAIGKGMQCHEDRYAFLRRILVGCREGLWPAYFMDTCQANLAYAGIHPASLLLSSFPSLGITAIEELLKSERIRSGVEPLGFGGDPWMMDIAEWEVNSGTLGSLDGLHTVHPTTVFEEFQGTPSNPDRTVLGNHMVFGNDLKILSVDRLTSLGDDIHVFGDLHLDGMTALAHLGNQIKIEWNLIIHRCPALKGLPLDLEVGGSVSIPGVGPDFDWGTGIERSKPWAMKVMFPPGHFTLPPSLMELQTA